MQTVILTLPIAQFSEALSILERSGPQISHAINTDKTLSVWSNDMEAGLFISWVDMLLETTRA